MSRREISWTVYSEAATYMCLASNSCLTSLWIIVNWPEDKLAHEPLLMYGMREAYREERVNTDLCFVITTHSSPQQAGRITGDESQHSKAMTLIFRPLPGGCQDLVPVTEVLNAHYNIDRPLSTWETFKIFRVSRTEGQDEIWDDKYD